MCVSVLVCVRVCWSSVDYRAGQMCMCVSVLKNCFEVKHASDVNSACMTSLPGRASDAGLLLILAKLVPLKSFWTCYLAASS